MHKAMSSSILYWSYVRESGAIEISMREGNGAFQLHSNKGIKTCLCQSIESNNNKYVYRQSQVLKPTESGVEWAECSLIIGRGCRLHVFSLILDSSVGLSADIQSAGDLVSETLGANPAFSRGKHHTNNSMPVADRGSQLDSNKGINGRVISNFSWRKSQFLIACNLYLSMYRRTLNIHDFLKSMAEIVINREW